jgi:hypothetical protein
MISPCRDGASGTFQLGVSSRLSQLSSLWLQRFAREAFHVCAAQHPDFYLAFEQWHSSYWQIIERNEKAESPFVRVRGWRRLRRTIKLAFRRFGNWPDLPIIPGA